MLKDKKSPNAKFYVDNSGTINAVELMVKVCVGPTSTATDVQLMLRKPSASNAFDFWTYDRKQDKGSSINVPAGNPRERTDSSVSCFFN